MQKINLTISEQITPGRLDKIVAKMCQINGYEHISRAQITKAIKSGNLELNGHVIIDSSHNVRSNDIVNFTIREEINEEITATNIPLDIVYEDEHLIVINKQANLTTHPGANNYQDTLVNALKYHTAQLSDISGDIRAGIVHRLDKDTTGLMVVAKNNQAHHSLAKQIQERTLKRIYKALIFGVMNPPTGTIEANIGRSRADRVKMSVVKTGGKHAITHYQTLEILAGGALSLVKCQLDTGRTHQIRVHMSHAGHSIVGDQTYGHNTRKLKNIEGELGKLLQSRTYQALHSCHIEFEHPVNGQIMQFEKELPVGYNDIIIAARAYLKNKNT